MSAKPVFFCILLLCLNVYSELLAQDTISRRPRIGLVLSGGGAKGLAHIGVLKVLEEIDLPIDYITGTSMGSVVGGLYSCGYSAKKIEYITRRINWNEILLDQISRKNISIEEKDDYERYVGEFPLVRGRVTIPRALVDGQKVSTMLAHYTWPVHTISNFDSLPIPFRCIATDIEKVQPVLLKSGFLPDAIRASMAIPSFFSPIELDGQLLVDGGIVRNFPVQDARDMGADIIIGVEVSASLYTKEELNSVVRIMDQVSSFQADKSNKEQAAMCDFLIKPDIQNYNMFSFDYIDSLILNGERAARKVMPQLKTLADSIKKIYPYSSKINRPADLDSIHITAINYEGLENVSGNLVKGNFEIKDTGWIKLDEIELGVERLYGTRFFERVNYKIVPGEKGSELTLRFKEQPFNYFKFSMHYDQYLKTAILLNGTYRNVLGEGSRLMLDLKLGQYPGASVQYSIHTFAHPNIGVNVKVGANSLMAKFYTPDGLLMENFNVFHYLSEADLFSTFSKAFLIRSGFQVELLDINKEIEAGDTINYNLRTINWYTRLRFDTQDRTVFPVKGDNFYGELKYVINSRSFNLMNWNRVFWRVIAQYSKYIPFTRRLVLVPSANAGFSFIDNLPVPYYNFLGGFITGESNIIPFEGLKFMTIMSNNVLTAGLTLRAEPWKDKFLSLKSCFATTSGNFEDLPKFMRNYFGIGIAAGMRTIVGPVEVSVSKSNYIKKLYSEIKIGYMF